MRPRADTAQRALGSVVVDLDAAVVDVARQRLPAREAVADRLGQLRLGRHARRACRVSQACSSSSSGPARAWRCSRRIVGRLAADVRLDRVQRADAPQRLRGDRVLGAGPVLRYRSHNGRRACAQQAASTTRPLSYSSRPAAVGIGLQDAAEVLQVLLRMLALAVGRVAVPGRRRLGARRPVDRRARRPTAARSWSCRARGRAPSPACRRHAPCAAAST